MIPVAEISTGLAVLLTGLGTLGLGSVGMLKLRPERQSLIAQAAEHATASIAEAFGRLERELERNRREVGRLEERELDLMRRITELEDEHRRELQRLRGREQELLARIQELEHQLTRLTAPTDTA